MIFYSEIIKAFQKHKVKYVIAGGIAVNLHGSLRSSSDMDILVEMSDDNLKKVVLLLQRMGYRVKQAVNPLDIADARIRRSWIKQKNMKAFNFYKGDSLKEVDIIIDSPVSYEDAERSARRIRIDGAVLPVISIDNLIKMKSNTGRAVDRLDVEQLRKIKKLMRRK